MKQWYTARELAELGLPGLPTTKMGMIKKATAEGWENRPRTGSGGGNEYSYSAIPETAKIAIIERMAATRNAADIARPLIKADDDKDNRRRDAKLIIMQHLELYRADLDVVASKAMPTFLRLYAARQLKGIPEWVYETYPDVAERTVWRWRTARKQQRFDDLQQSQNNRSGTGVLDIAEGGQIAAYIGALLVKQPHLSAVHVRDLCLVKFGFAIKGEYEKTGKSFDVPMPTVRMFQTFISNWKDANADLFEKLTNPDAHKNKNQMALGKADDGIERLNQMWQIDASPADALCVDGRYSIYAIIDVWSRRALFSVSRTACTEASLLLVRRAIMEWGIPEIIKTDNGSDFVSYRFTSALLHIGIEQRVCQPFTPEGKGHVERVIKTMQHDLMPLLPGFVGHSVKDRKQIETRKAFAQRLGETDERAFAIGLTHEQLQDHMNRWALDKYAHKPHGGLNDISPFARAASWTQPVRRIENERALDMLLAPLAGTDGFRTVGKKGLRIDNGHFYGPGMELHVGKRVFVRHDPEDMGVAYVFDEDHQFICEATNLDRLGADRKEAARMAKASQKQAHAENSKEIKRIMRGITPEKMAEDILSLHAQNSAKLTTFPVRSESYTSPSLDEAARAFEKTAITERSEEDKAKHQAFIAEFNAPKVSEIDESLVRREERLTRLLELEKMQYELEPDDQKWLDFMKTTAWFKARIDHEEMKKGDLA